MKVAPLFHALNGTEWCNVRLVHTGQHYDVNMSDVFFSDLGLPAPDINLDVGSGSHAEQTAGVMTAYEQVCLDNPPDWIIVVGDVNSTAACCLVGVKLLIPVIHLEAGLRSGDRSMPEEINRLVTDTIADVLWTPSADADENLKREGVSADKIDLVGNIMIDSLEMMREKIEASNARSELGLADVEYALVTLHRPSNVDYQESIDPIVEALVDTSNNIRVVLVAHPRTLRALERFDLKEKLISAGNLALLDPLPYVQFMNLLMGAKLVITDSGGLQEETTYLNIPCLTMRENTERPITITQGTNRLVRPDNLAESLSLVLENKWQDGTCPPLWDGQTAKRAVESLQRRLK